MSAITQELEKYSIRPVIIGGAAVEFYTRNWYATGNIDLAVDSRARKTISEALESAGFKKIGRMWMREDLDLYIKMPGDVRELDIGRVTKVESWLEALT